MIPPPPPLQGRSRQPPLCAARCSCGIRRIPPRDRRPAFFMRPGTRSRSASADCRRTPPRPTPWRAQDRAFSGRVGSGRRACIRPRVPPRSSYGCNRRSPPAIAPNASSPCSETTCCLCSPPSAGLDPSTINIRQGIAGEGPVLAALRGPGSLLGDRALDVVPDPLVRRLHSAGLRPAAARIPHFCYKRSLPLPPLAWARARPPPPPSPPVPAIMMLAIGK